MIALFLVLFVAASTAQTYNTFYTYGPNTGCTGNQLILQATLQTCDPNQTPTCSSSSVQNRCVQGVPAVFPSAPSLSLHSDSACATTPTNVMSFVNTLCVQTGATSFTAGCAYGSLYYIDFTSTNVCLGSATYYGFTGNKCTPVTSQLVPFNISGNGRFFFANCAPPCFHEQSEIASPVTGAPMTLKSLLRGEHPECHIPHQIKGNGVKLSVACPSDKKQRILRVTNDHLVHGEHGNVEAGHLRVGDVVFADLLHQERCHVTSMEQEIAQNYFGLNCKYSNVVADGVAASTFGKHHAIPAAWMRVMSSIVGVDRASRWGDAIVTTLSNWNLM